MISVDEDVWDVIVIGAGPAGCVASTLLARRGHRVLLVERSTFPRGKVCGCCLSGKAIKLLRQFQLESSIEAGIAVKRFHLFSGGRSSVLATQGGITISRSAFDSCLADLAQRAGVTFQDGTRATLLGETPDSQTPERSVELDSDRHRWIVKARVVLIASGLGSIQSAAEDHFGENVSSRGLIGLTAYLDSSSGCPHETIQMAVGQQGYVGITRLEDGRLNLSAAVDKTVLKSIRSPSRLVERILQDAGLPLPENLSVAVWMGTRELTRQLSIPSSRRVFVLGDAAGYLEPFTGQGMYWAMSSAVLVQPYVEKSLQNWNNHLTGLWTRSLKNHLRSHQRTCRLVSCVMQRPAATRFAVLCLQAVPWLALPFLQSIHGSAPLERQLAP